MQTICMDGQCLKNYLQMVLNELKTYQDLIKLIKSYDEDNDKGYVIHIRNLK